ncbi:MAG TPA: SDR family oxidoreductase [Acidimicrobiales bacterium]
MILIAGGTGRLGKLVVDALVDQGLEVRILSRNPSRTGYVGSRVELVTGDVRDRDSLDAAVSGVDVVVSAVHGFTGPGGNSPESVDHRGNRNLIDAAKAVGADFVLVSTVGAAADSPMELFRMKYAAERYAASMGIPTTVVRATAFLELWIELLRTTAGRSGRPLVFGHGDNPLNFVSVIDVAAVVELAVTESDTRGKTLEIGGPDDFTFNDLALAVMTADGDSGQPRHVPPPALKLMAATVGRLNPQLGRQARAALVMDQSDFTFDSEPIHKSYPGLPNTSVADVLALGAGSHS